MKKIQSLGLLIATVMLSALTGCALYYGDGSTGSGGGGVGGGGGGSGGSGSAGSGGSGSSTVGDTCSSDAQCAPGCYCADGTCTEGGFCTTGSDCGSGYYCNTSRSSCEPGCGSNADCGSGSQCENNTCTATCTCTTDASAVSQGYGWCDNGTCATGTDPNGSCGGTVTCNTAQPTCPSGQVPTITNGCWTGNCEAISACDVPPACPEINDQTDCAARSDCNVVVNGIDCTTPTGAACQSGDANCTCTSFVFASCATLTN